MRRPRLVPTLLVAAATWLAAGPGGSTIQAIAGCEHHRATHAMHPDIPPGAPCYCDHMTGGHETLAAPAAPAPVAAPVAVAQLLNAVPFPLPPSLFPGFSPAPTPPPPNAVA